MDGWITLHDLKRQKKQVTLREKDELSYKCEICENSFSTNQLKEQHKIVVHGREKNYERNVSSKTFDQEQELTILTETNPKIKNHHCKFCGKLFASSGSLRTHIKKVRISFALKTAIK